VYVATRIDPAPAGAHFAIRGAPSAIDATARTFTIGGVVFSYGSVAPPTPFAAGELVRAVLAATRDGQGRWVVTAFGQARTALPDGRSGSVDGVVSSVADATHFVVNGATVDATNARVTPTGATVGVQSRVVVKGTVSGGVLVANSVHVHAANDNDNGSHGNNGNGDDQVEIDGPILTLDTAHQTFTMRGPTTVSYASASFAAGSGAADLAVGKVVDMTGNLSADGTYVIASTIKVH